MRRLARLYDPIFVVPIGVKVWLAERGIDNAVELNWGESVTLKELTIVCTPASGTICFTLSGYWILDSRRTSANSARLPARLDGPTSFATRATGFPPTRTVSFAILPPGWARLIGRPAGKRKARLSVARAWTGAIPASTIESTSGEARAKLPLAMRALR